MSSDTKNLYLAIFLSCLVIIGWSFLFAPKPRVAPTPASRTQTSPARSPSAQTSPQGEIPFEPSAGAENPALASHDAAAPKTRAQALAASARVKIDAPAIFGSLSLKGARIDDVSLKAYRETTDPKSPNIVLLSPQGAPGAYYAEAGFVAAAGQPLALPGPETLWRADHETLTPQAPLTLSADNGQGLVFKRVISIDDHFMFTIKDSVENTSEQAVTLAPYALVARRGLPQTANYAVLHEGFVGVIGDSGVEEIKYDKIEKESGAEKTFSGVGGWLGFTDKYWAATVIPDQGAPVEARFSAAVGAASADKSFAPISSAKR